MWNVRVTGGLANVWHNHGNGCPTLHDFSEGRASRALVKSESEAYWLRRVSCLGIGNHSPPLQKTQAALP